MGSFAVSSSAVISPLSVAVYIDGKRRSDIYCTSISFGAGTEGSTANLSIPSVLWDGGKSWLRGKPVEIRAGYNGSLDTIWAGYIGGATGDISANMIEVEARSLVALSDTVYLGQDGDLVAEYPSQALRDGVITDTGWTIKSILYDIWSSSSSKTWRGGGGSLPSQWRSRLKLGSLAVLSSAYNTVPLGDITMRQTTLRDALDQLIGLVGTISFRERFWPGGVTYIDWYELADPTAPIRDVRVAQTNDLALGTNVLTISHQESVDDVRTRLIGLGAPQQYVISVQTDSTDPLVSDWDDSLEASVLANPHSTKAGSESAQAGDETRPEYTEARRHVFRRYKLPVALRSRTLARDLGIELTDGSSVPITVYKFPRILSLNSGTGAWESTLSTTPQLLEGAKLDLTNYTIVLKDPAVNLVSSDVNAAGEVIDTYEEAVIGVTLAYQGDRLRHDTGARTSTLDLSGIDGAGLTEVIVNDSFQRLQLGDVDYDAYVLQGDTWTLYDTNSTVIDDSTILRQFTEAALREKLDIRTTYSITTPWWTSGYRLGERIRIIGQNDYISQTHQIQSIMYDLTNDHSTSITTDSAVPMMSSQLLGGK